jgi:hypothetical protein
MKKPPATAAFIESVRLHLELHALFTGGLDESLEADAVRDAMDQPWYDMTDDEQGRIRQLSADLYTIGDRSVGADPGDDLRAALGRARAAGDAETVLSLLQEHAGLAPPAERSRLRGEAWTALGVPQAASMFIEDAIRAASPPAPPREGVRPRFPRLRRIAEAA